MAGQTPIAIVCAFSAWRLLPPGNRDKEPADHETTLLQNLDVMGIALFAASMGSVVLVLDLGGQTIPWDHPLVSFSAIFGCFSAVALFINEWKRKGTKLLPPDILLSPGLHTVFVGQILFNCAIDGVSICNRKPSPRGQTGILIQSLLSKASSSLGPYFAWTERFTATATAARLWPLAIGSAAGALTGSQIISRYVQSEISASIEHLLTLD